MPIDPEKALGAETGTGTGQWKPDDVLLYHLGLGAGARATDPKELEYTFEKNLKVLPSFGVIPVFGSMGGLGQVPELLDDPRADLLRELEVENDEVEGLDRQPLPDAGERIRL